MAERKSIAPDSTIRQAAAWPACAAILERFDQVKWDNLWSLQELAPFARRHRLDEQGFINQLAEAAGTSVRPTIKAKADGSPVRVIFIALALGLTLGAGWGVGLLLRIAMGVGYDVVSGGSVHVHGVAQLWGWMALFVFAVGTHLLRQNTKKPAPAWLEQVAAVAIVAGLVIFFIGLADRVRQVMPWIDLAGSGLLGVAAALFGISVIWSLKGRGQKPLLWHGFVLAMLGWLWVWAGCDGVLRLKYAGMAVLPDGARNLLIVLPVLGFAVNAIYGFGIRLIPGLLNIGNLRPRWFATTLVIHNLGLVLSLLPWHGVGIGGAGLMFAGAVVYLVGQNGLRSKPSRQIFGIDPRGHILIRVAFFWLLAGLGMVVIQHILPSLPHAFSGAWRHALTVGFITTMILGVAQRMLPVFIKQPLASNRLMLVSAGLIIVGNAGRVTLELATIGQWTWAFRLMGLTGLLELTSLALFAFNLVWTVRNRRHIYLADEPLRADTRVREAVNVRPQLQHQLRRIGVTMLDDAPFIAPSLTFGAMALAWGRQPEQLLADLAEVENNATTADQGQTLNPLASS
ncbi:MAG: hypothetical protein IT446_11260 [Phycisphaerales bacterium]|nr:hypothetical protein [Phycisphaerales bacterium]